LHLGETQVTDISNLGNVHILNSNFMEISDIRHLI
jgi:hypothetical protein